MCDDGHHSHDLGTGPGHERLRVSRRGLLKGMVALAAVAALPGCKTQSATASGSLLPSRAAGVDDLTSYVMGMHLHASASEGVGSTRSQLAQAAQNGFDVAWLTEHDWRRNHVLFRPEYHFTTNETAPTGGTWTLQNMPGIGSLASTSGAAQVTTPLSPNNTAAKKASLRLRATSKGTAQGTVQRRVNCDGARENYRGRIAGRSVSVDVLPSTSSPDAWGEVLFTLSHHPGTGSRPTGQITLLYRLRTDVASKATSSQGLTGIVDVPVTAGTWQTVAFDLLGDLAAIWSDVDPRDNSLNQLDFRASSRRQAPAEFFFGYLRFTDQVGYDALGVETDLMARYAAEVPGVLGLVGTEISLGPHVNQFGGTQKPYDYQVTSLKQAVTADYRSMSDFIHANGGLASINHPFKAGDLGGDVTARSVATNLLAVNAGGADILEVGYLARHGAVLADYVAVWDALSRNGLFLTANGVSDDHTGQNWATQKNRFYTAAWSTALHEDALVAALASGRSYVGYLGGFAGTVDMTLDDDLPMGAVAVNALGAHTMHLRVTGVPSGGSVQILQGHLDYAGTSDPTPNTQVVKTIGGTDLGPSVDVPLTADDASFFRVQVVDRSGAVVALGQPTWLLDQARTPVPAARQSQAGTGTTTG